MTYSLGSPPGGTLTAAQSATDDKFPIVDTSVGADDAANKTITVAEAKALLAPSFTSTTPALVQHKKASSSRTATPTTFTLDSSPTVGNTLFLVISGVKDGKIATPSGWTLIMQDLESVSSQMVTIYYRDVQSGDGTSWSFTTNTNQKNASMIEVSNAYSWSWVLNSAQAGNDQYAPGVARSLADTLVFFAIEQDNGMTSVSVDADCTKLHEFVNDGTNHTGVFAVFNTVLTYSGTTRSAQCKATWSGGPSLAISVALAIHGQVSLA